MSVEGGGCGFRSGTRFFARACVRELRSERAWEASGMGICRVCAGELVLGDGILFRQDRAPRDELAVHGVLPVSVCDSGAASLGCSTSPRAEPARMGVAGLGFVSGC